MTCDTYAGLKHCTCSTSSALAALHLVPRRSLTSMPCAACELPPVTKSSRAAYNVLM